MAFWQHPTYPTNSMHRTLHDARELFSSHLPISVFPDRGQFCPEPFRSTHNPSVPWKLDIGKLNSPLYIYRSAISSPVHMIWTPPISTMLGQGDEITPLGSFGTIEWVYSKVTTEGFNKPSTSTQRPAMWFRMVSTITDTPALVHLQELVTCADLWKLGNIYIYYLHSPTFTNKITHQTIKLIKLRLSRKYPISEPLPHESIWTCSCRVLLQVNDDQVCCPLLRLCAKLGTPKCLFPMYTPALAFHDCAALFLCVLC